jgi:hypothetical protein
MQRVIRAMPCDDKLAIIYDFMIMRCADLSHTYVLLLIRLQEITQLLHGPNTDPRLTHPILVAFDHSTREMPGTNESTYQSNFSSHQSRMPPLLRQSIPSLW